MGAEGEEGEGEGRQGTRGKEWAVSFIAITRLWLSYAVIELPLSSSISPVL